MQRTFIVFAGLLPPLPLFTAALRIAAIRNQHTSLQLEITAQCLHFHSCVLSIWRGYRLTGKHVAATDGCLGRTTERQGVGSDDRREVGWTESVLCSSLYRGDGGGNGVAAHGKGSTRVATLSARQPTRPPGLLVSMRSLHQGAAPNTSAADAAMATLADGWSAGSSC